MTTFSCEDLKYWIDIRVLGLGEKREFMTTFS